MGQSTINQLNLIEVDETLPPSQSLMEQFETLVVSSLCKAFGLKAAKIEDQDGGNVDTLETVRKYEIKDPTSRKQYEQRGIYESSNYHGAGGYREKNKTFSEMRDNGTLIDAYTGENLNRKYDLDHTISAKEIHNDAARILAGLDGVDLANHETNLNATNFSINRSKNAHSMEKTIEKFTSNKSEYEKQLAKLQNVENPTDKQLKDITKYKNLLKADFEKMKTADKSARSSYNKVLAQHYYTNETFMKNAAKDVVDTGYKMGIREVLGYILTEVWVSVRKGIFKLIAKMKAHFNIKDFFLEIADIFKTTFNNVVSKYKKIIEKLAGGFLAGVLSSITTTIINIFVGTAKRVVQVIRECWASIVEIANILFFSKEHTTTGQKIRAIVKVLIGLATVLLGTAIHEAISKIPGISAMPIIGEGLAIFLSSLVTGVISIGLLYFVDHMKDVKQFFTYAYWLKDNIEETTQAYKTLHIKLAERAAELAKIPFDDMQKLISKIQNYNKQIEKAKTNEELQIVLKGIMQKENIKMGYSSNDELLGKLRQKTTFVFE